MSGVLVVAAVPGEEGDPSAGERADADGRRRRAERCGQLDLDRVVEELVEAGPAEHADLSAETRGAVGERDEHQLDVGGGRLRRRGRRRLDFLESRRGLSRLLRRVAGRFRRRRLRSTGLRLGRRLDESEDFDSDLESPSFFAPVSLADFLPRLSVLKNPLPLKVTPTGVNTFLTARTSPESGWVNSVRVASVKACWTSMVSPVSTNL